MTSDWQQVLRPDEETKLAVLDAQLEEVDHAIGLSKLKLRRLLAGSSDLVEIKRERWPKVVALEQEISVLKDRRTLLATNRHRLQNCARQRVSNQNKARSQEVAA